MFKRTLVKFSPIDNSTTPLKLLGFNHHRLKNRHGNDTNLASFLLNSLSAYPLHLIITNSTRAFSYPLQNLVLEIETIGNSNRPLKDDPNDHTLLIDYNIIDQNLNKPLYDTFKNCYKAIPLESGQNLNSNSNIVIVSFTKEGLQSDTSFIKSFKEKYEKLFDINACILNTHIFPFLRSIKKSNTDNVSVNMYNIASLGLVNVEKNDDGSLILTNKK